MKSENGFTFERHIKDLTCQQFFGVGHPIDPEEGLLGGPVLISNRLHRAPSGHHVSIMNHFLPVHVIAATRQRDPQHLADQDVIRVGYAIHARDLLVSHQPREHVGGDVVEAVAGLDDVLRPPVGDAGAVGAEAFEWDAERLQGGYGRVGSGREVEVVGSE